LNKLLWNGEESGRQGARWHKVTFTLDFLRFFGTKKGLRITNQMISERFSSTIDYYDVERLN